MASPCVSQATYHSATTASVVWLLALNFTFIRCVSPCPQNFNIGCCANEKLLRLIAHRHVRFFTFMFVSTLVLGARGELIESNSSFGNYCASGDYSSKHAVAFPCMRLDSVSSASKTCLDYVWSANVFMLSVCAILPAQVSLPSFFG